MHNGLFLLKMKKITIAIDGFSACGKSTLAKDLAEKLGYIFIDSGAMYRAVSLFCLRNNLIENGIPNLFRIKQELPSVKLQFKRIEDESRLFLNDEDVSVEIRTNAVANIVSKIAAIKEVREKLVAEQRQMGINGGIIMDGRDIGSVVFPHADLKIFVTANEDIRVQRRFKELISKGILCSLEEVRENLKERDFIDSNREISPLIRVPGAMVIDNSNLSREEQVEKVMAIIQEIA
jgi:cytidylate kinase